MPSFSDLPFEVYYLILPLTIIVGLVYRYRKTIVTELQRWGLSELSFGPFKLARQLKSTTSVGKGNATVGEIGTFDLRSCQETLTYEDVLTAEDISMHIELSIIYGIAVSSETIRGEKPMTPAEKNLILRICTYMPDWKKVVQEDIAHSLREAVANYRRNDLLTPATIEALSHQVQMRSRRRLHPHGIRVSRVSILNIRPDDEWLRAATQARIDIAQVMTQRDKLRIIADAYNTARKMGMSDADIADAMRGSTPDSSPRS